MRRFDKTHNIAKVNLLAEQRHLVSKCLVTEGEHFADVLDVNTEITFDGKDAKIIAHEYAPYKEAVYTIEFKDGTTTKATAADSKIKKQTNLSEFQTVKS